MDIVAQYPIDCVFFGGDWGQQRGLIMGYETICGSDPAALGCVSFKDFLAVPDIDIPNFLDWFRPIIPVAG